MDIGLNSYINVSEFWHFIVFVYDGALCWNSFELYLLPAKLKCICSYICSYAVVVVLISGSLPVVFTFCASNSPFHPAAGEGKGRVSKHHVLWNVSVRALNWGILFLNHSGSSLCGILLQLWRNRSLQKESKTGNKKQVLDAAEAECVQRCVTWLGFYPSC